jgi:hypothetical protein
MNTTTTPGSKPPSLTARSILLEWGGVDLGRGLQDGEALKEATDVLSGVGASLCAGASAQLAELASEFLDVDVAKVMLESWRKYRALQDAAASTRDTREIQRVSLATHTINLVQHPRVDVVLGDRTIATVRFELEIVISADGLVAVVRGGKLVALTGGTCRVHASFSANDVCLGDAERTIEPHLFIALGDGVPLYRSAEHLPRQEKRRGWPGEPPRPVDVAPPGSLRHDLDARRDPVREPRATRPTSSGS